MWKDILVSNKKNIINSIGDFEEGLKQLKQLIENQDEDGLVTYLEQIKVLRDNSIDNN